MGRVPFATICYHADVRVSEWTEGQIVTVGSLVLHNRGLLVMIVSTGSGREGASRKPLPATPDHLLVYQPPEAPPRRLVFFVDCL